MVSPAGRRIMVAALAIGLALAVLYGLSSPYDAHGETNGAGHVTSRERTADGHHDVRVTAATEESRK